MLTGSFLMSAVRESAVSLFRETIVITGDNAIVSPTALYASSSPLTGAVVIDWITPESDVLVTDGRRLQCSSRQASLNSC